ncbi:uncharacterized protein LTR77_007146 [Saxophila tyrrhenica]|uniref:Uncharacterized protein n=1 Tax=Saxophila tyrrhenica TaxID=1690608 RepID=A0AAV9P7P8_9PEZI|nr:hypothetical protein LTR77_007146 [Saxophila tyrrhenica]
MCQFQNVTFACTHVEEKQLVRCDREYKPFTNMVPKTCVKDSLPPRPVKNDREKCMECAIADWKAALAKRVARQKALGWYV